MSSDKILFSIFESEEILQILYHFTQTALKMNLCFDSADLWTTNKVCDLMEQVSEFALLEFK